MDIAEMFKGMDSAELNGKGGFITGAGKFRVKVKSVQAKEGFKGKSFKCDFEILTSTNKAHKPSTSGAWIVKLDRNPLQAFGDIKGLFFAISGVDPKTVRSAQVDPQSHAAASELVKVATDPQYLKKKRETDPNYLAGLEMDFAVGRELDLETIMVKTGAGKDFTVHNWSPASEESKGWKVEEDAAPAAPPAS